jgi:hypothetical protein
MFTSRDSSSMLHILILIVFMPIQYVIGENYQPEQIHLSYTGLLIK